MSLKSVSQIGGGQEKITKCNEILDRILGKKENPSGETDEIQIRSVV